MASSPQDIWKRLVPADRILELGTTGIMEEIKAEDGDLIEDTSDLGEDDDDIGEVMEHLDEDVEDKA